MSSGDQNRVTGNHIALGGSLIKSDVTAAWRPIIGCRGLDLYNFYCYMWDRRHELPGLPEIDIYTYLGMDHRTLHDTRVLLEWCDLIRTERFGRSLRCVILAVPPVSADAVAALLTRLDTEAGAFKWPATASELRKRLDNYQPLGDLVTSRSTAAVEQAAVNDLLRQMGLRGPNLVAATALNPDRPTVWAHWWQITAEPRENAAGYLYTVLAAGDAPQADFETLARWWLAADEPDQQLLTAWCQDGRRRAPEAPQQVLDTARTVWRKRRGFGVLSAAEPLRKTAKSVAPKAKPKKRKRTPPHPLYQALMDAYVKALGYTPDSMAREGRAAKSLLKQYPNVDDIINCYHWMKRDTFWANKHLGLSSVHKQMGAYMQSRGRRRADETADLSGAVSYETH